MTHPQTDLGKRSLTLKIGLFGCYCLATNPVMHNEKSTLLKGNKVAILVSKQCSHNHGYLKKFLNMFPGDNLVGVAELGVELVLFDSTLSGELL